MPDQKIWSRLPQKQLKEKRQAEAEKRQEAHDKMSAAAKLAKLDEKFGFDQGAKKERARLREQSKQ
jgi:hypothetical protein